MSVTPETEEVRALRLEMEARQIDFRQELNARRMREFKMLAEALARSDVYAALLEDYVHAGKMELSTVVSLITTGIQLGLDIERTRNRKLILGK